MEKKRKRGKPGTPVWLSHPVELNARHLPLDKLSVTPKGQGAAGHGREKATSMSQGRVILQWGVFALHTANPGFDPLHPIWSPEHHPE